MSTLRVALRALIKSPASSVTTVCILALGIGASTAIFSVVYALLISPLQYRASAELVQIQSWHKTQGAGGLAPATFGDLSNGTKSFGLFAAQYYYYVNLTGTKTPTLLNSAEVTADYFKLFGVAPSLGRALNSDDFKPGAPPVIVIGQALWRTQFGSRESLVGQQIMLDDIAHMIVGVMPASFKDPSEVAQLWRPMRAGNDNPLERSSRYWTVFARLNPGITVEESNREFALVGRQLELAYPQNYEGWSLRATDLRRLVIGDYHRGLLVILCAVGCVMLITCVNVAGLSLTRTAARRRELAVRAALGSSRRQLVSLLLIDNFLLAAIGGGAGILLARWGLDALLASLPGGWVPRSDEIGLNLPVLAGTLVLTTFTGFATGIGPGLTASAIDANDALKDGHRGSSGPSAKRLRSLLVITEIALALILLAASGLLCRSFVGLLQKGSGLDAGRILSLTVSLPQKRYNNPPQCWDFFSRAQMEVSALAGVDAAGFTQTSPFRWGIPIHFSPLNPDHSIGAIDLPSAFADSVSVDFFKAAGISLRAGRLFTPDDDYRTTPKVIISETAARRYFGSENPLGRFIFPNGENRSPSEIVGIVGDVRRAGLAAEIPLQVYRPFAQRTPPFATLMVRTSLPPATLAKSVQAALWRIDPEIPISDVAIMDTYVSRSITQPRIYLLLFSLFAGVAVSLAMIGLGGLIGHGVEQRTREFGIRAAIGASPQELLMQVLQEGAGVVSLGVGLGLFGAFLFTRLLSSMLYDVPVHDPVVFVFAPVMLTAIGMMACFFPARRVTRADPMAALRAE
jgi:putative ABC transport system permease protein